MSELKTNLQSILQEKNTKIIPQNIKKDVEVLDVTGSYDKEDIKELQDELADAEQELADVRRDLDNSTATVSGSGENVTLSGTAEARFKKAPLPLGNTEQEVIEAQAGTTVEGESILANGVDLSKVEILNINGNTKQETTTGKNLYDDNFDDYNQPYDYYIYPINLEQGETYTLSATLVGSNVNGVAVAIVPFGEKYSDFSDNMQMCLHTDGTTNVKTFTVNDTWTSPKLVLYLGYSKVKSVFDSVFENYEIQLEKSSAKTDYEPYTGGKASPNPDYPQEAYSAGANMNLFDKNNVISNAYLDSNGNEAFDGVWNITDYIPIISNKVYSYNGITTPGVAPYSAYYDSNKNFISSFKQAIGKNSIIVPSNAAYVRFSLAARNTDPIFNDLDTFKFEKGNETTAYSAYNQGNMNVEISNKNLFDGLFELGTIDSSGVKQNSSTAIRTINFISINPNTQYILSSEATQIRSVFYDENYRFVGTHPASFTSKENEYYMKFVLSSTDLQTEAQLEKGSTATTYVVHEGQSFTVPTQAPFRKINNVKDTFVKKVDGKWYEKHIIREIIFDGTEYWSVSNNVFYLTSISDYANSSGKICLSNKYTTIDNTNAGTSVISQNNSICFFNTNTNPRLYIRDERFSTVADFTAWLAQQYANGIPVYANYILAVPIYIECTQEQSDILDQINTFYETTNIFSTDEVSSNFTFTYNKVYASPSPDDESPIQTVSGDVKVVVGNKNLFDKNNAAILNAYISNNTITANSANRIFYLKVKPSTTYAITKYKSYYFTVGCVNKIPEIGDTLTNIQYGPDNYIYDGSKGSLIYTTDATAQYIVCRFYQTSLDTGVSLNDMLGSIQVEVNSIVTDYAAHQELLLPLALKSKNLLDLNKFERVNPATTVTVLESGINIKNVTTGYGAKIVVSNLKENTNYYLQYNWKNISNGINKVRVFAGTSQSSSLYNADNLSGFTFNTGANTTINIWLYAGLDTIAEVEYTDIQLEEGSTPTSYELYYNYELCKIGDYRDYFWKDETTNKWYLHKEIDKTVLDGTTTYIEPVPNTVWDNENPGYIHFQYPIFIIHLNNTDEYNIKSNYFIGVDIAHRNLSQEQIFAHYVNGVVSVTIKAERLGENITASSTKQEKQIAFNTWLSKHNLVVYYVLKDFTDIEITNTTLVSQLEAIRKAISYDEQTNVSSNTIALFDIIALRNMNDTLNTLENEIELLP